MRSAAQIGRTVEEWHDHQARQRARALRELLSMTAQARARGEFWVGSIDAGCPDVRTDAGRPYATGPPARRAPRA